MRMKDRLSLLLVALPVCFAVGLSGLFLLNNLSARGVVYGTVHICRMSVIVNNDACYSRVGYEAIPGAKIQFVRTGDSSRFTAVTDASGYYSISMPVGHYTIPLFVDGGPKELNVIAGHKLEANFQVWRLPQ
jgi:hypothetical protein